MSDDTIIERASERPTRTYSSVEEWIYSETNGVVLTGPFKDMKLIFDQAWKDGNLSTKCLGCYEEELHPFFEYEIGRLLKLMEGSRIPKIVDIGCAEGYYAVGLARRVRGADVYGVDISKECLEILRRAAELNDVFVMTDRHLDEVMSDVDLMIVDVEGDENVYLDLNKFPSLAKSDIVVECHDYDQMSYTSLLTERFSETHDIQCIFEGARNPNKFQILRRQQSQHRWLAVCEGRPCTMNWLTMRARR